MTLLFNDKLYFYQTLEGKKEHVMRFPMKLNDGTFFIENARSDMWFYKEQFKHHFDLIEINGNQWKSKLVFEPILTLCLFKDACP